MADITFDRPEQQSPLARFIQHYWRTMAAIVTALIVGLAAYAWYDASVTSAAAKAANELGTIIATKTGQERTDALESYIKTAPSATKPAALLELARTAQEQNAFGKAADAWNQLSLIAPEGLRENAILGRAATLAQAGDKTQAVKILMDFLPKAPKVYQPVVARQLAVVAEEAQSWNEALAAYEKMKDAGLGGNKAYYEAKIAEIKSKIQ